MRLREVILRGTRATQPAGDAVDAGVIYCVTDEGNLLERSNGTAWEAFSPIGGPGVTGAAQDSFIVSGGGITWEGTDYLYRASAAVYYIKGVRYTSLEQTIALSASDPDNDRIDVLALDTLGALVVVEGDPAPAASEPDIDPTQQIKLGIVIVKAASTEPEGVTNVPLYAENAGGAGSEWTWTSSGATWALGSTNNPHGGTKCIEGTTVANGAYVQGAKPAGTIDPNIYDRLILYLRSKAAWNSGRVLRVQWFNAGVAKGTPLTIASGYWGFDSSITTGYQLVVLPIAQFAIPLGTLVNQLRITDSGGSIGFYLDDIALQAGGGTGTSTNGLTQDQADARYAALVHASRHQSGGADAIKLDDLAAPDDNTDLDASTAKHGLLPKLDNDATHFLNGQGGFTTPPGAGDMKAPATNEDHNVPQFKGADSREVEDSGYTVAEIISAAVAAAGAGDVIGPAGAEVGNVPTFSNADGKQLADSGVSPAEIAAAGAALAPQGDLVGPAGATDEHIAVFDGVSGKLAKDGGKSIAEVISDALGAAGTGDVVGPGSAEDSNIAVFDTTTGKLLKDGAQTIAEVIAAGAAAAPQGDVVGPAGAVDVRIAVFDSTSGKLIKDGGKTIATVISDAAAAAPQGDVTAAAAIDDNTLVRGDGGAKGVQKTGITVDDSDNVIVPGTLRALVTIRANGTLSGTLALVTTDATYQTADPGAADRDVTLPQTPGTGRAYCICNVGADKNLVVKAYGGTPTVCTIAKGESRNMVYDGSAWVAL